MTPVIIGVLLDLVDFFTAGPVGFTFGFILGGGVTWLLLTLANYPREKRLWISLLAGIYCTSPLTEFLPLGTLLGTFISYRQTHKKN